MQIVVVGAGIFGVTAALTLRRRGHDVTLIDPGPIPHPLAESTDLSKAVRMDYGADADYTAFMERALDGWRAWNRTWPAPLFHETGVTFLTREPMAPGGFEYESHALLSSRGHPLSRLDGESAIRARFPAWRNFCDGYFNPAGGWAESGKVVAQLAREAQAAGVALQPSRKMVRLVEKSGRVTGIVDERGDALEADRVILATGSWTGHLLPHLAPSLTSVGQPVFHLRPSDPSLFLAERFPVFGADISRTGYYGFPLHPDGIVKVANHGIGRAMHPEAPERTVTDEETRALRDFLADTFPDLATAPIVATRTCVYGDTRDEHFWIASDPDRPGLTIAAGGSGHGFKFAPLLGDLIADAALGIENPSLTKFRHRPGLSAKGEEAARHHED
jgi:glycine/D-amino acid oxidase-like deaminating enzyme